MLAEGIEVTDALDRGSLGAGNKENVLIHAARELYHELGYGRVTSVQLAKAAGLSLKEVQHLFPSQQEICLKVIVAHKKDQRALFEEISQNGNPRQRLAIYMDRMVDREDQITARGCAITNLYFDTKREDAGLADKAAELLQDRLDWIRDQFVVITHVENPENLAERLTCAIQGIYMLAQATSDAELIRNQVNQLKSWIRSM